MQHHQMYHSIIYAYSLLHSPYMGWHYYLGIFKELTPIFI